MPSSRRAANRRSNAGFVAIPYRISLSLGSLADATLVGTTFGAFERPIYLISMDATVSATGQTVGEGPIRIGVAHGAYTDAQVEECVEVAYTRPSDLVSRERARRLVRDIGTLNALSIDEVLNDGKPIRTKLKFTSGDAASATGLRVWAYNWSGGAVTPSPTVRLQGFIYGRWR